MSELDPETHRQHDQAMAHEAAIQQAINVVLAKHPGHDVQAIMEMLRESMAAHGVPQPPYDWLNAVAAEISLGHRYVVGTQSVHDAEAAEDHRRH